MAQSNDSMGMLDLMIHPGFCVKDNLIVRVNPAAESYQIMVGTPIRKMMVTGWKEYSQYTGGCLYLMLDIQGRHCSASVTRMGEFDVFLLDQEDREVLQVMALAARELRDPMTSIMSTAESLFPTLAVQGDSDIREQLARMNRGLYQMLRMIGNMSDAERYSAGNSAKPEVLDITALMAEIFGKAQYLLEQAGISLEFTNLAHPVLGLADRDMLERTVLNLLSNSLKFTPKGGTITASLVKHGNTLSLTIQDNGDGIADSLRSSIFHRYQRQSALEDRRQGMGLGMVLVRSTAAQHGGTVLVDRPGETGTRITMTLAIRQNTDSILRSPRLRIDYAGERDHSLIELADILPAELYHPE